MAAPGSSIVEGGKLVAAWANYRRLFSQEFANYKGNLSDLFANPIRSTGAEEVYRFMNQLTPMSEFRGERKFQDLRTEGFTLRNKVYSNGVKVAIDDINDDKLDMVEPQIRMLAQQAQLLWNQLMAGLLDDGITDLGYDGVAYFSASHPLKSGVQINTRTGHALSAANFATTMTDMETQTDYQGTVLDIRPTHLVCHPNLRATAEAIVEHGPLLVGGSGAPNPNYKKAMLIVNPFLTVEDHWYLMDLSKPVKPFVKQVRQEAAMYMNTDPNQESIKNFRVVEPWAELRGAMGYSMHQLCHCGQA